MLQSLTLILGKLKSFLFYRSLLINLIIRLLNFEELDKIAKKNSKILLERGDCLNGIAYYEETETLQLLLLFIFNDNYRLLITGKKWPFIAKIKMLE